MENHIRTSSSDNKVKTLLSGEYHTHSNQLITYRIYQYTQLGDTQQHIYHLLLNEQIAYWIIGAMVNAEDVFIVNNEIKNILKTAQITI
jgi:hypothetical protein